MGIVEFRGLEIQEGDRIKITICKDVVTEGVVVFYDAAYSIKHTVFGVSKINALVNYAHTCKFELLQD